MEAIARMTEEYQWMKHRYNELDRFFKNPHSNPELLEEFSKNITHPEKKINLLTTVYLFCICKKNGFVRLKIGCSRNAMMRIYSIDQSLGRSYEIHLFDVVAGFELERFLKIMFRACVYDNEHFKTEIFDIPELEYNRLIDVLKKFAKKEQVLHHSDFDQDDQDTEPSAVQTC